MARTGTANRREIGFLGRLLPALTEANTLAGWRHGGGRTAYGVLLLAGVLSVGIGSGIAVAQSTPVERPTAADPYADHITEAAQRFGIPKHWIRAVLRAESAGNSHAISSAGAMGLMQVMPDTWTGLRVRYGLGRDPYDPRDNILAGAAYLREMWDRYDDVAAMLAAYNAGPGRYDEYLATGRTLPPETRTYVAVLTPILGGAAPSDAPSSASAPPPDWREAPLFVMRSGEAKTAPRRRSTLNPATPAQPSQCVIPPTRSSQPAAFSSPAPTTGERHEGGVPAHCSGRSGVQSGRVALGCIPGRKGGKGEEGGGQDKRNRHYAGRISEIVVACTLVRGAASGTLFLVLPCRSIAQHLGFAGI